MNLRDTVVMMLAGLITLAAGLLLLRTLAPGLLGLPQDLQLVQLSEEVPPFYENVFRAADFSSGDLVLRDPMTRVRMQPLVAAQPNFGPHDILGFRNREVPNIADVVVIGDSQTYGTNVPLTATWPTQLESIPALARATVYNVSAGGWGAVQYYDMFRNVTLLRPRVIVIAFYSGNDPLDSFVMAYGNPLWSAFRVDDKLDASDAPRVAFPPPQDEHWPVRFADGSGTVFTPTLRLASNRAHPAVDAGWEIMLRSVAEMRAALSDQPVSIVVTVIPTKESAFSPRILAEGLEPPADYRELVEQEEARIATFAAGISAIPDVVYVDVVTALRQAASQDTTIYASDFDGHPRAAGHAVIARTIATAVAPALPAPAVDGLYAVDHGDEGRLLFMLLDGRRYFFPDHAPPQAEREQDVRGTLMDADEAARYPVGGYVEGRRAR